MKSIPLTLACAAVLAGCQVTPDRLPQAEPLPAASCHFPYAADDALKHSVDVLTEWGFKLDNSDTALGLVSASRARELHGYYDPYDNAYGYGRGFRLFGGYGVARHGGIGVGFGTGIGQIPTEVERVSILASDDYLRITRDIRRFDHLGDMRESYTASNDDFCQRFAQALPRVTNPNLGERR